ncbi:hypothetical protein Hanom_Chr08g00692341 [Helianthus anomalus]
MFFFSEPSLCSTVVSNVSNSEIYSRCWLTRFAKKEEGIATRQFKKVIIVSDESLIALRTRSKFRNKSEYVVVDKITPVETASVTRKRSTLKRSKTVSIIDFTEVAENILYVFSYYKIV